MIFWLRPGKNRRGRALSWCTVAPPEASENSA